jgi:hypothetical protein
LIVTPPIRFHKCARNSVERRIYLDKIKHVGIVT